MRTVLLKQLPPCAVCKILHGRRQPAKHDSYLKGWQTHGYTCEKHYKQFGVGGCLLAVDPEGSDVQNG